MASRQPSSSLRSSSSFCSCSCSSSSVMCSMACWRLWSALALTPTATAMSTSGAATVSATLPATATPAVAPASTGCACRRRLTDRHERRVGRDARRVHECTVDPTGHCLRRHRANEALTELGGDLRWNHHAIQAFTGGGRRTRHRGTPRRLRDELRQVLRQGTCGIERDAAAAVERCRAADVPRAWRSAGRPEPPAHRAVQPSAQPSSARPRTSAGTRTSPVASVHTGTIALLVVSHRPPPASRRQA